MRFVMSYQHFVMQNQLSTNDLNLLANKNIDRTSQNRHPQECNLTQFIIGTFSIIKRHSKL